MFISTRTSLLFSGLLLCAGSSLAADMVPATLDTKAPCEKPVYPRASLMNEETGVVTVGLLVAADGSATDSKIEKSSGFKNLDKAAKTALAACKFKPAANKEPTWMKIDYSWKLE
jgi:protein TonB